MPEHVVENEGRALLDDLPRQAAICLLEAWPDAIDLRLYPEKYGRTDMANLVQMLQDHGLIMLEAVDNAGKQVTILRDLVLTYKGRQALRARHGRQ